MIDSQARPLLVVAEPDLTTSVPVPDNVRTIW
jgi:hypothetical protein